MNNSFLNITTHKISFLRILLIVAVGIVLNSCLEERLKETEDFFEGYGDVYVQKKMVNGETVYAPFYILQGNTSVQSVSVETPGGETVELEPFEYLDTYFKNPADEEFSATMIETGTYQFKGSLGNNEPFTIDDSFYAHIIDFPVIDSIGIDSIGYQVFLFWDPVVDADVYKVNLLNNAGNVVFDGPALTSESNAFVFNIETVGWKTTPYKGDIFTLRLHAYLFDEDADDTNWFYNIECNAYSETQITWGGSN